MWYDRSMNLGSKLRQLRQHKGWTLDEAFRASGISGSNISRLEDGQSPRVAASTLAALAQAYEVNVLVLYEAAGWYEPPTGPNPELSPSEKELIDVIRSAPSVREKLIHSLIDVAKIARDANRR